MLEKEPVYQVKSEGSVASAVDKRRENKRRKSKELFSKEIFSSDLQEEID